MRALNKVFRTATSLSLFLARNLWCAKDLTPLTPARCGGLCIEPLSSRYLAAAGELFASLNPGVRLGVQRCAVMRLLGSRLCLVVRQADRPQLVGMSVFYFNARDRREGTVHEGYIGLREAECGKGLGTFMRRHALEHFARCGLAGASSRILAGNLPSLKSNLKLGFVPVETCFDPRAGEEQHYLVCDLRSYRQVLHATERKVL